ncbi:MAG TPA: aldo/keto reductase [bacterium]|nr:aldo/keto reductase [bacterium]
MEYVPFGTTGVKISSLGFGTMSFGGDADETMSAHLFSRCRDAGINVFDCANVYQDGRAEQILGSLIRECRDEVLITSKVFFPAGDNINDRGASRRHIVQAAERSLKRLDTDYIDIYFLHRFDPDTPLEETLRALDDLIRAGKVLYLGVSNFAAWQIMKSLGISNLHGWNRVVCVQPMYNLVKRQAEVEILPLVRSEQLAVMPYSPLGGGLLTGKYGVNRRPESGRLVENEMYRRRYEDAWMYDVADRFTEFAREQGFAPAALAIAWVAGHPDITAPLLGARNPGQLEGALQALEIDMTEDLRKAISDLSVEPPPATDRIEERKGHTYKST